MTENMDKNFGGNLLSRKELWDFKNKINAMGSLFTGTISSILVLYALRGLFIMIFVMVDGAA
ncbi:MAG: hypothetical protein WCR02_00835 [Sphaerochaetaceae bacterium]